MLALQRKRCATIQSWLIAIMVGLCGLQSNTTTAAGGLITTIPRQSYAIPAGPLNMALPKYAEQAGIMLGYDPVLTEGLISPGLKGEYSLDEGFKALLKGTGLEVKSNDKGIFQLKKSPKIKADDDSRNLPDIEIDLKETQVRASRFKNIGPLPGLALTKEQIAGNIQSISAKEIKEAHSLSLSDLMNSKLQSVNVNDYQGNPFQMDVTYRGFTASPQLGTPQGLSVFFDGIRVNEPFGDVVNWDMIPMNALGGFDVFPGSNPLFGLNTLGGALSMKTKSGFTDPGVSADILTGSYGRKQLQASGGWNNGTVAAFGAVNLFMEDGWRDNSPSKVNQAFGKVEWQGERASLSLSSLIAVNKLIGNGTVPQELYRENPASVFTSPDETRNRLMQFQIAGAFDITDITSLTGQIYHRDSTRISSTGDIIDQETFSNAGNDWHMYATNLRGQAKGLECGFTDAGNKGFPDYYVVSDAKYSDYMTQVSVDKSLLQNFVSDIQTFKGLGLIQFDTNLPNEFNVELPPEVASALQREFKSHLFDFFVNPGQSSSAALPNGVNAFEFMSLTRGIPFVDKNGNTNYVFAQPPKNIATCISPYTAGFWNQGMLPKQPAAGNDRDGANSFTGAPGTGRGVIEGTPTGVITNSNIQQTSQGAALQMNWNLDQHKFMVGASVDKSYASYLGKQRLGLLDNKRNVYSDPYQLGEEFYAADHDLTINDFDGTSETKSLYFSENWAPIQTLNLAFSARYNDTKVKNNLAPSIAESGLENLHVLNHYAQGVICPGSDLSNCPYSLDAPIDAATYWDKLNFTTVRSTLLDKKQTEQFGYRSLNPAFGATWQAKPNLNLYANWNQGTRAPSVIELGCAFDSTLVKDEAGNFVARSIADGRGCKLPSALSGDPYLPQVKAQTMEAGARGKFKDFLEWNVSAYRTDVQDDIYLVSVASGLNFFQSIGDTRRQGIEFGLAGEYGRSDFRINYSLTEATYQSYFKMISPYNSSRSMVGGSPDFDMIQVKPGNVLPGVPFNNINFNWGYKVTRDFKVNMSVVAHSGSFLRGNENNAHTPSPGRIIELQGQKYQFPSNEYSGTAPGYAVLNMSARYNLGKGWAVSALVNNVLDKTYYTAGRLGLNPFAPSTYGLIGPGGFNYNSNEWVPSQFISAGAPRGVWVSLSYDFDASKKGEAPPSNISMTEPDRTTETPSTLPTQEELALMRQLDKLKAVPVLKQAKSALKVAEQEVKASVEAWRKALADNNAEDYLNRYAAGYAPAGNSHNRWVEQQKLQLSTDAVQSVEVHDVVVAPQGQRMVAVFSRVLARAQGMETTRTVLTLEQKEGAWLIVREHALPMANTAAKPVVKPTEQQSSMLNTPPEPKLDTSKKLHRKAAQARPTLTVNTVVAEVK